MNLKKISHSTFFLLHFTVFLSQKTPILAQMSNTATAYQQLLNANGTTPFQQIVVAAHQICRNTEGSLLLDFLPENAPIYTNRLPFEAIRLRGFLLARCAELPPSIIAADNRLLHVLKAELSYRAQPCLLAAAARAAAQLPDDAAELMPLLTYFLDNNYTDDITDIDELSADFSIKKPTTVRYEVIATLRNYGHKAYAAMPLLQKIASDNQNRDTILVQKAKDAVLDITQKTPPCCRIIPTDSLNQATATLFFMPKSERNFDFPNHFTLTNQNGKTVKTDAFIGKPFVVTFFYTRCHTPTKCAATVQKLAAVQKHFAQNRQLNRQVRLLAISYDSDFDDPSVLRVFGEQYGVVFTNEQTQFLNIATTERLPFFEKLKVNVGYSDNQIAQHGVQIIGFDKKGKRAFWANDATWTADDVVKALSKLKME